LRLCACLPQAGLCENEKEKKNSSQSREGAKASGSQYAEARIRRGGREVNHNFFAALRLCENKKK
jgi:hypothetical protein